MGAKISKRYTSLKSILNLFNLFLNCLLIGSHKNTALDCSNFEFPIFNEFFNFTIVPMGKSKNLNFLETSDRRAKQTSG